MRSQTLRFEVWQRVQHATIDLGFIGNIPAVPVTRMALACLVLDEHPPFAAIRDRKSTRLNSSHSQISYAVFCLKKKKNTSLLASHAQPTPCSSVLWAPT